LGLCWFGGVVLFVRGVVLTAACQRARRSLVGLGRCSIVGVGLAYQVRIIACSRAFGLVDMIGFGLVWFGLVWFGLVWVGVGVGVGV
jgi:hypothetical protein